MIVSINLMELNYDKIMNSCVGIQRHKFSQLYSMGKFNTVDGGWRYKVWSPLTIKVYIQDCNIIELCEMLSLSTP